MFLLVTHEKREGRKVRNGSRKKEPSGEGKEENGGKGREGKGRGSQEAGEMEG